MSKSRVSFGGGQPAVEVFDDKASSLVWTMRIVNSVFKNEGLEELFYVPQIDKKPVSLSLSDTAPDIIQDNKILSFIRSHADINTFGSTNRLDEVLVGLHALRILDERTLRSLKPDMLEAGFNKKVDEFLAAEDKKLSVYPKEYLQLGEALHICSLLQYNEKGQMNLSNKDAALQFQYTDETKVLDQITVAIRTLKAVICFCDEEMGLAPHTLDEALGGKIMLSESQDKLIRHLVQVNITASDVTTALQRAAGAGSGLSGLDALRISLLVMFNFPLSVVLEKMRMVYSPEVYDYNHLGKCILLVEEQTQIIRALKEYFNNVPYFVFISGLVEAHPHLKDVVNQILELPASTPVMKFNDKLMRNPEVLKLMSGIQKDGQVLSTRSRGTNDTSDSFLLKVDSASDVTLVREFLLQSPAQNRKTWGWIGGSSSFVTTHDGFIAGKVTTTNLKRPSNQTPAEDGAIADEKKLNKRHKPQVSTMDLKCGASTSSGYKGEDNILGLNTFLQELGARGAYLAHTDQKSFITLKDNKRIPLVKRDDGWYMKVMRKGCKSNICCNLSGLIRIVGGSSTAIESSDIGIPYIIFKSDIGFYLTPENDIIPDHACQLCLKQVPLLTLTISDNYEDISVIACESLEGYDTTNALEDTNSDKSISSASSELDEWEWTDIEDWPSDDDEECDSSSANDTWYTLKDTYEKNNDTMRLPPTSSIAKDTCGEVCGQILVAQEKSKAEVVLAVKELCTDMVRYIDVSCQVKQELKDQVGTPRLSLSYPDAPKYVAHPKQYYDRARRSYQGPNPITLSKAEEIFHVHELYNHRGLSVLRRIYRINLPMKYSHFSCEICTSAKLTKSNSKRLETPLRHTSYDVNVGEVWHMDLKYVPKSYGAREGHLIVTRVDRKSRSGDVEIVRYKSQALLALKSLITRASTGRPKEIRLDRGGEFLGREFELYCLDNQIRLHPSASYQHGQNGVAERFHRTMSEHLLASMIARQVPLEFWPEGLRHEVYVYNRTPHSGIEFQTPIEVELGRHIDTWDMRGVFGCKAHVIGNPDKKRPALRTHVRIGMFLGIDTLSSMGTYKIYMLDTKKIIHVSDHVEFFNDQPGYTKPLPERWESDLCHFFSLNTTTSDFKYATTNPSAIRLPKNEAVYQNYQSASSARTPAVDEGVSCSVDASVNGSEITECNQERLDLDQYRHPDKSPVASSPDPTHVDSLVGSESADVRAMPFLRDRNSLRRPDYFVESAAEIYSAPQLKSTSSKIMSISKPSVSVDVDEHSGYVTLHEDFLSVLRSMLLVSSQKVKSAQGYIESKTGKILSTSRQLPIEIQAEINTHNDESINRAETEAMLLRLRGQVRRDFAYEAEVGAPPTKYSSIHQALNLNNPHRDKVIAALLLEILTLLSRGTFGFSLESIFSDPEGGIDAVGTQWLITVKDDVFKARLVARGDMQDKTGMYTYAPTMRKETTRQIIAKAAQKKSKLHSLDIRNAFIHEPCAGNIYLFLPHKFWDLCKDLRSVVTIPAGTQRLKLKRMLYGLAQSPVVFYTGLHENLLKSGLRRSFSDPCHYHGRDIDVGFHVDDGLYTGSSDAMSRFEDFMKQTYDVKDVGVCENFTGLRTVQLPDGIYVHQIPYIQKLCEQYLDAHIDVNYAGTVETPMETNLRLEAPGLGARTMEEYSHLPFKELRCSLQWVASGTRPDIAYAVSILGAFDYAYDSTLYKYCLRVLKYLKGTIRKCIRYSTEPDNVGAYLSQWPPAAPPTTGMMGDANCLDPTNKFRGRGGFICMVQGGPIAWSTKTLRGTSLGSYDSEFKNLSHACMEGSRLYDSLVEFDLLDASLPLPMLCDNTTALLAMERPAGSSRQMGHVDKHYYYVQDKLRDRLRLGHLGSTNMVADILTKPLGRNKFKQFRDFLLKDLDENILISPFERCIDARKRP